MKLVVAVLCVFVATCSKTCARSVEKTHLDPLDEYCSAKTDKNILVYDANGYMVEDSKEINELLRCNWSKIGLICDGGKINLYKLQRILESNLSGSYNNYIRTYLASKTISDCNDVKGKNDGDTCVKMYNCVYKRMDANIKRLEEEKEEEQ